MDTLPVRPDRLAQLEDFARRRGKSTADALDDALAEYLEWERQDASLFLSGRPFVGRQVANRTGIAGLFDIRLEFAPTQPDSLPPALADNAGPSIFTALQEQLGLRLQPGRGPGQFLVIDSVERPTED